MIKEKDTFKRQTLKTDPTVISNNAFIANYDEMIQAYKPTAITEMTNHKY